MNLLDLLKKIKDQFIPQEQALPQDGPRELNLGPKLAGPTRVDDYGTSKMFEHTGKTIGGTPSAEFNGQGEMVKDPFGNSYQYFKYPNSTLGEYERHNPLQNTVFQGTPEHDLNQARWDMQTKEMNDAKVKKDQLIQQARNTAPVVENDQFAIYRIPRTVSGTTQEDVFKKENIKRGGFNLEGLKQPESWMQKDATTPEDINTLVIVDKTTGQAEIATDDPDLNFLNGDIQGSAAVISNAAYAPATYNDISPNPENPAASLLESTVLDTPEGKIKPNNRNIFLEAQKTTGNLLKTAPKEILQKFGLEELAPDSPKRKTKGAVYFQNPQFDPFNPETRDLPGKWVILDDSIDKHLTQREPKAVVTVQPYVETPRPTDAFDQLAAIPEFVATLLGKNYNQNLGLKNDFPVGKEQDALVEKIQTGVSPSLLLFYGVGGSEVFRPQDENINLGFDPQKGLEYKPLPTSVDADGSKGIGTGFSLGNGYVATAAHVVDGDLGESFMVKSKDGTKYSVQIVAKDDDSDAAIVYSPRLKHIPAIPMGDSDQIDPAKRRFVVTMGFAGGREPLKTVRGVTARSGKQAVEDTKFDEYLQGMEKNIQELSSEMYHGQSGGPTVDIDGRVVGINSFGSDNPRIPGSQGNITPINRIKDLIKLYKLPVRI